MADIATEHFGAEGIQSRPVTPWFPSCPSFLPREGEEFDVVILSCGGEPDIVKRRRLNYGHGSRHPAQGTIFDANHVHARPARFVITENSWLETKTYGRRKVERTYGDGRTTGDFPPAVVRSLQRVQACGAFGSVATAAFNSGESEPSAYGAAFWLEPAVVIPEDRQSEARISEPSSLWRVPMFPAWGAAFSYYTPTVGGNSTAMTTWPEDFENWVQCGWARVMAERVLVEGQWITRGLEAPLYRLIELEECSLGDTEGLAGYLEIEYVPWRLETPAFLDGRLCYTGNAFGQFHPIPLAPEIGTGGSPLF